MNYETLENIFSTKDEIKYWQAYLFVYCNEKGLDVDTKYYDELVEELYDIAKENWEDFDLTLDEFYNNVSKLLV